MEQFRIEVANDGLGYVFDIKALGNRQYEIFKDEVSVGTIEIDGDNHEHCKTVDCEIDLPLLNKIREGVLLHESLSST